MLFSAVSPKSETQTHVSSFVRKAIKKTFIFMAIPIQAVMRFFFHSPVVGWLIYTTHILCT